MTKEEEAIKELENIRDNFNYTLTPNEVFDMAIHALEHIDEIKQIIAIDNSVIQEDVIKYKMICEVVKAC